MFVVFLLLLPYKTMKLAKLGILEESQMFSFILGMVGNLEVI